MEDWFVPLLILAAWYMVRRWVLLRFGVPPEWCQTPAGRRVPTTATKPPSGDG